MAFNGGLGIHSMWGFSPSMDLLSFESLHQWIGGDEGINILDRNEEEEIDDSINILLVQPSDPRHIIHTLSQRFRKADFYTSGKTGSSVRPINFFILENETEVLARHLLLLHVFFDEIPIRHKAALFLEIYGNALVQQRTETYIAKTALLLRELIYQGNRYGGVLTNMINFDHLKQKDCDDIDSVLKSWSSENQFDIISFRDHRLRGYYGNRFDWYVFRLFSMSLFATRT
jgi:dynein assembly factor 3